MGTDRQISFWAAMKIGVCPLFLFLFSSVPVFAEDVQPVIKDHYEKAFLYYRGGDYGRAIQRWSEILKLDSNQRTARSMIEEARGKVEQMNRDRIQKFYELIVRGNYKKAALDLELLLDQDPTHPRYQTVQARLERVIRIVPKVEPRTKAWLMVSKGLSGYLGKEEDLTLAYNGLRHAADLDPEEPKIGRLQELLEAEHPDLARLDRVTPGMKFLDYKKMVSLHHIYDGKFHLAVNVLNEVLALEPADLVSLKRLGSAYYALGHKDRARKVWREALSLAPHDDQLKAFLTKK